MGDEQVRALVQCDGRNRSVSRTAIMARGWVTARNATVFGSGRLPFRRITAYAGLEFSQVTCSE
jgi:hypothetical protein